MYKCVDGIKITCGQNMFETDTRSLYVLPRNGIQLAPGMSPLSVVAETELNRDMTEVIRGGPARTYSFQRTVASVRQDAFIDKQRLCSVRFNDGLKTLGERCFSDSGIGCLIFPSSVCLVDQSAFEQCRRLRHADLRAARGLRELGQAAFSSCQSLQHVLLGDGLETIGQSCFSECAIGEVAIPRTVKRIGNGAFHSCKQLKWVSFAESTLEVIEAKGFAKSGLRCFTAPRSLCKIKQSAFCDCHSLRFVDLSACLSGNNLKYARVFLAKRAFESCSVEEIRLPRALRVIGERAFAGCKGLKEINFDADSALEEILPEAFYGAGLELFVAPPSLRRLGDLAFGACNDLKEVCLNGNVQNIGYLCLWRSGILCVRLP